MHKHTHTHTYSPAVWRHMCREYSAESCAPGNRAIATDFGAPRWRAVAWRGGGRGRWRGGEEAGGGGRIVSSSQHGEFAKEKQGNSGTGACPRGLNARLAGCTSRRDLGAPQPRSQQRSLSLALPSHTRDKVGSLASSAAAPSLDLPLHASSLVCSTSMAGSPHPGPGPPSHTADFPCRTPNLMSG